MLFLEPAHVNSPVHFDLEEQPQVALDAVVSDGGLHRPCLGRAPTASILKELEDRVCIPLETLISISGPRLRRTRALAPVLSIRRCTRLAAKPRAPNAALQAQSILMQTALRVAVGKGQSANVPSVKASLCRLPAKGSRRRLCRRPKPQSAK